MYRNVKRELLYITINNLCFSVLSSHDKCLSYPTHQEQPCMLQSSHFPQYPMFHYNCPAFLRLTLNSQKPFRCLHAYGPTSWNLSQFKCVKGHRCNVSYFTLLCLVCSNLEQGWPLPPSACVKELVGRDWPLIVTMYACSFSFFSQGSLRRTMLDTIGIHVELIQYMVYFKFSFLSLTPKLSL